MFKKKKEGLSWREIHALITNVAASSAEDSESEWSAGYTDEEESESEESDYNSKEIDYPSESELSEYLSSESDDCGYNMDDNDDYDSYNRKRDREEESESSTDRELTPRPEKRFKKE